MENFTTIKPKNAEIQKYIDSFYFHTSDEANETKRIVFFPNTKNALTIYKNAVVNYLGPNHFHIQKTSNRVYCILYAGIQKNHIISEMESPFEKIGVIFKPLGINYFVNGSIKNLMAVNGIEFRHFNESFYSVLDNIYNKNDVMNKVDLLESFFIDSLKTSDDLDIVKKAIALIENEPHKIAIHDVSNQLNISTKTLNRKFTAHLNCTPKQYSMILSFRKSLNEYIKKQDSLTAIALNSSYYDQSDFIKNFKKLTGQSPLKMLKQIKDLGNNIYWIK